MPLFSILIPTKNRCEYLTYAVKSLLKQSYQDFEIIISDNNSSDQTKLLVEHSKDKRIKYLNTGRDIPLTDNWNNAFKNSKGEYIILMGDDDYMLPSYLKELKNTIEEYNNPHVLFAEVGAYHYPDPDSNLRKKNVLYIPSVLSHQITCEKSRVYLEQIFRFTYPIHNSAFCFSKTLAKSCMRGGVLYQSRLPDFYSICALLLYTEHIIHIDRIHVIIGRTKKSVATLQLTSKTREKGVIENPLVSDIPTPLLGDIFTNDFYQTLMLLKNNYPEKTRNYKIDVDKYYVAYTGLLLKSLMQNRFKSTNLQEYNTLLTKIPKKLLLMILVSLIKEIIKHPFPHNFENIIKKVFWGQKQMERVIRLNLQCHSIEDCVDLIFGEDRKESYSRDQFKH